jgi:hypothetical protein
MVTSLEERADQAVDEPGRNEQDDDTDDRGQVEWPERRESPKEA